MTDIEWYHLYATTAAIAMSTFALGFALGYRKIVKVLMKVLDEK